MIAYKSETSTDKVVISNSEGVSRHSDDFSEIADFLLWDYGNQFKIAWDINQFAAPILALLPKDKLTELFETGKTFIRPYSINFNQNKSFYIKKGGWHAIVFHLSQYFDGEDEPETLRGVADKGAELLAELDSIGIQPAKLTSPITMLNQIWDEVNLTTYRDMPDEIGELAWEGCGRNWVEAIKIGHTEKAWDYDIQAAFPWALSELLDLRYGNFIESKDYVSEAYYGFARGRVAIDPAVKISPTIYTNRDGHQFNISGSFTTVLPKQEIDFIREYQTGKFKIDHAWWWIPKAVVDPDNPTYKPLYGLMHRLFGMRQKSALLNRILKLSANGIYGKTIQIYENRGGDIFAPHFNAIYGAMAETEPKLKVARFIYDNKLLDCVLHISTDGTLVNREVKIPNRHGMGEWRLDSTSSALIVSSGNLFYADKKPVQLYYPEAMELIRANPKARNWEKSFERRMTLGDTLMHEYAELGKMKRVTTSFGLDIEHDRDFEKLPENGWDLLENLYDSKMLKASDFKKS